MTQAPVTTTPGIGTTDDYQDTGCEVSATCLACPLALCKFDDMDGFRAWKQRQNDLRILALIGTPPRGQLGRRLQEAGIADKTFKRIRARTRKETQG